MRLFLATALAAGTLASSSDVASAQQAIAVTGATLIDGRGGAPIADAVVVTSNGAITAVGPKGSVTIPANARIVSAAGKFVIPGLMDANVHLVYGVSIEFLARYEGRFEDLIEEGAQIALENGVTTVFDSWGPLEPLMKVRDRINRGEIPGSRLFVAGNIIGLTGPFGRDFNGDAEKIATKAFQNRINQLWEEGTGPELMWLPVDSVKATIRRYIKRGPDFLKYAASGHTQMEMLMFSPEQQRAIVEAGHEAGIVVQTHTTSNESLREALDVGVDLMQHCSITGIQPMPDAIIARLKTSKTYCAIQSLTRRRVGIMMQAGAGFSPRVHYAELTKVADDNETRLIAAGVPVLLATDAGIMSRDERDNLPANMHEDENTALGEAEFLWFQAVAEKGMKPMDAILAATRNIAAAYHRLDRLGTLEVGKRADLVVLDADPLADLANIRKISLVMKDGVVVDRAALPRKTLLTGR